MKKEVMREERRLAFLMIAWRMPEIFTSLAAAVASASMAVWLEFVENVSVMIPAILLAVLSGKLRHNLKYSYNYGTGKLEAITAFACEIFDLTGLFCILFFSIRQFFRPDGEEKKLVFALCMSLVGLGIDVFLLLRQRQLSEREHSKMLHTAFLSAQKEFAFDFIAILAIAVDILFSRTEWVRYFSPALCILVAVPFICQTITEGMEQLKN